MAQRGLNKACLMGYLGQTPEVRYMAEGSPVASFFLATRDNWKEKGSGEVRERIEWHQIVVFGKLAELAGRHLTKGAQIYLEGTLRTRRWQDKQGRERQRTEIIVDINGTMLMLGKAPESAGKAPVGYRELSNQPGRSFAPPQEEGVSEAEVGFDF